MALALREEYTHTSLRARHHRRYTSDTHPCRCHAALYGHHASRPPTMPGKHGVPHDRKRHTLSNIPPVRLECNYIGGTGRCGGEFRLTSLQIQGSEDFCFGYQAVTKKWCSQLFRNLLIGCFYSKNAGTLDGSRIFLYLCRQSTTKRDGVSEREEGVHTEVAKSVNGCEDDIK